MGLPNVNTEQQLPVDFRIKLEGLHSSSPLFSRHHVSFSPLFLYGHSFSSCRVYKEIQKWSLVLSLQCVLHRFVTLNFRPGVILRRIFVSFFCKTLCVCVWFCFLFIQVPWYSICYISISVCLHFHTPVEVVRNLVKSVQD